MDVNHFVPTSWNRQPAEVSGLFPGRALSDEALMDGLLEAVAASERGSSVDFRLFIDQTLKMVDVCADLPTPQDTLQSYLARMRTRYPASSFSLVLRELHLYQPDLWRWLRGSLSPLYAEIGIPEDTVNSIFVGDYTLTPFGVHIDRDHTFYVPLHGHRRMLLWPPDYPRVHDADWHRQGKGGSSQYEQHRAAATVLEARPGTALYWPPGWWHVAEGTPGDAVALSIGIPAPGLPFAVEHIIDRLAAQHTPRMHISADDMTIPPTLAPQLEVLRQLHATGYRELEKAWLRCQTSGGFRRMPPARTPPTIPDDARIVVVPGEVVWARAAGELVVAANGYSFTLPDDDDLVRFLEIIGGGGTWLVRELKDAVIEHLVADDVDVLLGRIYAVRALEIEPRNDR